MDNRAHQRGDMLLGHQGVRILQERLEVEDFGGALVVAVLLLLRLDEVCVEFVGKLRQANFHRAFFFCVC